VFSGGADVNDLNKLKAAPAPGTKTIRDVLDAMERGTKTYVAAIDGNALGGGFELALASDYRVATATSRVGLPEIKLGLLPGAGGNPAAAAAHRRERRAADDAQRRSGESTRSQGENAAR